MKFRDREEHITWTFIAAAIASKHPKPITPNVAAEIGKSTDLMLEEYRARVPTDEELDVARRARDDADRERARKRVEESGKPA